MQDGIKIASYYTQQLCTPSRASLLTGMYPIHIGMQHDVIQPESKFGLPLGHKLLPAYLKELLGYETHMIGKWHLGHYTKEYLPQQRGFDNFFGYLSDQLWYYNHKSPHACASGVCFYDMQHNGQNAEESIGVYSTFLFTDVVQQILENSDPATPTMMYLSWQNVHAPLDPPPMEYFSAHEMGILSQIDDPHRRDFASMTMILDNAMKKVVGTADDRGFYENSVFIVASDNGGCPYSGGYNFPLRGAKQYLFEGGIRVNAFIHSPLIATEVRGTTYHGLVHVSDWMPTILYGMLHVAPDALPTDLDGIDQWKHMISPEIFAPDAYPRQEVLHNIDLWSLDTSFKNVSLLETPVAALRMGDWKLVMGQDASGWYQPHQGGCAGGQGYCPPTYESTDDCNYRYHQMTYLFNITEDPMESVNLAHTHSEVASKMKDRLDYHISTMVDPAYRSSAYHEAYSAWIKNGYFIGPFDE